MHIISYDIVCECLLTFIDIFVFIGVCHIFQTCAFCKKKGANIGCWTKQCRKSYHLPCAINNGCVYEFIAPFKSFCHIHYASHRMNTLDAHTETELCTICGDLMGEHNPVSSIQLVCCADEKWCHKECLRKTAFAFRESFDCPSCENSLEFRENMLHNGIYLPNSSYVPLQHIQTEASNECEVENPPKKRRVHKNYTFDSTFASKGEAENVIKSENRWSYYYANKSAAGMRITYRCNSMKFRGKQCSAGVYLLLDSSSNSVHLFRCDAHTHNDEDFEENRRNNISSEMEKKIREMHDIRMKPKAILYNLALNGFVVPAKSKLITLLSKLRKEKYGSEKLNFGSLEKWLSECSEVPTSENEPYIVNFEIVIDEKDETNSVFRFFVSTKLLLRTALLTNKLHTDATYKLVWQGFPVLLVGTTDSNKKFHPIAVCVTTNEKTIDFEFLFRTLKEAVQKEFNMELLPVYLICDAANAIRNGFLKVFGRGKIVICWAHVRRNSVKHSSSYLRDSKQKFEFSADLDSLQTSSSPAIFEKASKLFIAKWKLVSPQLVEYFEKEWLNQNSSWYEGFAKLTPSTNNALEAFNRLIKDEHTLRERLDISQFRVVLFDMVRKWSDEYHKNLNVINSGAPHIDLKWWTLGYQFARSNISIPSSKRGKRVTYQIVTTEQIDNSNGTVDSWTHFDDFKQSLKTAQTRFDFPVTEDNWRLGECNCVNYFKHFVCEHIIGIALRLKCTQAPTEAKTIPIGQKRKRGRPAKAKPALEL